MAESTATKYCRSCGQTKPATEFSCDRSAKDGLYGHCKQCDRERSRKNYASNLSARRARRRSYNAAHRDELCTYYRNYYIANADHLRARQQDYRLNNQDKIAGKKAVQRAIRHGILPQLQTQQCVMCGGQAADYHHHAGYGPESQIAVVALCRSCHRRVHSSALGTATPHVDNLASAAPNSRAYESR